MADTFNINSCSSELEENPSTLDNSAQSPSSPILSDIKMSSTSSPKRSRRGMEKRVVAIPLKEAQGSSRLKGETPPPSDSWSWRKYGQKPIKGSPYPRGYYRCSTSKGCPARKQVERSRLDPTVLIVTYSSDHNHPPKNNHRNNKSATAKTPESLEHSSAQPERAEPDQSSCPEGNFTDPEKQALLMNDEYTWFNDMSCIAQSAILESPVFTEGTSIVGDGDGGARMQMREEDESLFADLEELPECSAVFRRSLEEERRHFTAEQWCGTVAKTG